VVEGGEREGWKKLVEGLFLSFPLFCKRRERRRQSNLFALSTNWRGRRRRWRREGGKEIPKNRTKKLFRTAPFVSEKPFPEDSH